jgi:CRISPR-associated protein Cmr3
VRSKADRTWTYTDVHGNKLLRTRRIDDGTGKRKLWQECNVNGIWVSGEKVPEDIKQRAKAAITPYRYTEVEAAVLDGETIYWVEGEPCVDLLWKLGIPVTTTIGGSNSYDKFGNYAELLKGAKIVLCPDQDIPGSKYMDKVFADFPDAQWLYVFKESPLWSDLPKDKGLDIADWIESGATKEQIFAAIEPKRKLSKTQCPSLAGAPVRAISIEELQTEITALCSNEILIDSALVAKILSLAERSGRSTQDIWSLYNAHQRDLTKVDESSNVDELLILQQKTLTARGIFHPSLETLIEQTAIAMPTCEAWLITTLLPALGSSIGAKSRIVIKESSAYILIPVFWTAIVSKTGRKKTPTQYQIIHPLTELEAEAYKVWKEDNNRYKKEVSAQHRNSELSEPCEPSPRKRYITNSLTPEGLTRVLADIGAASSGRLRYTDEILALFQFNQYKNKGDEEQFYLSLFNGSGIISDRVDIDKSVVVERSCVSITGSIQWEILERLQAKLGFEDSSGINGSILILC